MHLSFRSFLEPESPAASGLRIPPATNSTRLIYLPLAPSAARHSPWGILDSHSGCLKWKVACITYPAIFIQMCCFDSAERWRNAKFALRDMQVLVENLVMETNNA